LLGRLVLHGTVELGVDGFTLLLGELDSDADSGLESCCFVREAAEVGVGERAVGLDSGRSVGGVAVPFRLTR
jgi:hypothetical protein